MSKVKTKEIDLTLSPEQRHHLEGIALWEKLSAENPRMLGATEEENQEYFEQESRRTGQPNRLLQYHLKVQDAMSKHAAKSPREIY